MKHNKLMYMAAWASLGLNAAHAAAPIVSVWYQPSGQVVWSPSKNGTSGLYDPWPYYAFYSPLGWDDFLSIKGMAGWTPNGLWGVDVKMGPEYMWQDNIPVGTTLLAHGTGEMSAIIGWKPGEGGAPSEPPSRIYAKVTSLAAATGANGTANNGLGTPLAPWSGEPGPGFGCYGDMVYDLAKATDVNLTEGYTAAYRTPSLSVGAATSCLSQEGRPAVRLYYHAQALPFPYLVFNKTCVVPEPIANYQKGNEDGLRLENVREADGAMTIDVAADWTADYGGRWTGSACFWLNQSIYADTWNTWSTNGQTLPGFGFCGVYGAQPHYYGVWDLGSDSSLPSLNQEWIALWIGKEKVSDIESDVSPNTQLTSRLRVRWHYPRENVTPVWPVSKQEYRLFDFFRVTGVEHSERKDPAGSCAIGGRIFLTTDRSMYYLGNVITAGGVITAGTAVGVAVLAPEAALFLALTGAGSAALGLIGQQLPKISENYVISFEEAWNNPQSEYEGGKPYPDKKYDEMYANQALHDVLNEYYMLPKPLGKYHGMAFVGDAYDEQGYAGPMKPVYREVFDVFDSAGKFKKRTIVVDPPPAAPESLP